MGVNNYYWCISYLIQLSGSFLQSVLHRKRSHANQPMGGVLANPFSKAFTTLTFHFTLNNDIITKITNGSKEWLKKGHFINILRIAIKFLCNNYLFFPDACSQWWNQEFIWKFVGSANKRKFILICDVSSKN